MAQVVQQNGCVNGIGFVFRNVVPLVLIGSDKKLKNGRLADLAPTMLDLMGLDKPEEMTGESLIEG